MSCRLEAGDLPIPDLGHYSPRSELPINTGPAMNIGTLLPRHARYRGDRTALVVGG